MNFTITPGEIFCLLGPNGCGKTTLLDCVLGLLRPQQGKVLLNGTSIKDLDAPKIARQVAYVPQSHEKTFPYTVMQIVLMGRASYISMFSSPNPEDIEVAEQALELVGISRLRDRPYTHLSGGEGQLVMVARALAQRTPLVIMDEPTAHLDFKHELTIMETIVHLVRHTGLSVLMATHFPNHCFYFENSGIQTRVALMNHNKFLAVGRPGEVLSERNLGQLYNVRTKVMTWDLGDSHQLKQVIPISTLNNDLTYERMK
ncbi:ABC transporter ATP-binding protein [Syntrophomonas erecta subsp. sporosyntropha]